LPLPLPLPLMLLLGMPGADFPTTGVAGVASGAGAVAVADAGEDFVVAARGVDLGSDDAAAGARVGVGVGVAAAADPAVGGTAPLLLSLTVSPVPFTGPPDGAKGGGVLLLLAGPDAVGATPAGVVPDFTLLFPDFT
jgi:hypothetical protein